MAVRFGCLKFGTWEVNDICFWVLPFLLLLCSLLLETLVGNSFRIKTFPLLFLKLTGSPLHATRNSHFLRGRGGRGSGHCRAPP